jgi:hypothetical protein
MGMLVSMRHNPGDAARAPILPVAVRFTLSQLAPHLKPSQLGVEKYLLRLRFVARGLVVCAVRLNGKPLRLPEQPLDGVVRQIGAIAIRDALVGGEQSNLLEFDLKSPDGKDPLAEWRAAWRAPSGNLPFAVGLDLLPYKE